LDQLFPARQTQQALEVGHEVAAARASGTSEGMSALEVMARHAVGYSHYYRGEFNEHAATLRRDWRCG